MRQRYAVRFAGISGTRWKSSIATGPDESGIIDAPARLYSELAELLKFKISSLAAFGLQRNGVWGKQTASQKVEHFGLWLGAFVAPTASEVQGFGVDGNGRIARAIADMALARSEGSSQRFYSLSAQIRLERKGYYAVLERSQRGDLDIADWLFWFFACLDRAIDGAEALPDNVLRKAAFWREVATLPLINRLLDGFDGKLTSSKWAKLTKVSPDTALRDISDLVARGVLTKDDGGGRSTSYSIRPLG